MEVPGELGVNNLRQKTIDVKVFQNKLDCSPKFRIIVDNFKMISYWAPNHEVTF